MKLPNGAVLKSYNSTTAGFTIQEYSDSDVFHTIPLVGYDAILGMPWLKRLNPDIDWVRMTVRTRPRPGQEHLKATLATDSHVPSLITSARELVRELKKGGGQLFHLSALKTYTDPQSRIDTAFPLAVELQQTTLDAFTAAVVPPPGTKLKPTFDRPLEHEIDTFGLTEMKFLGHIVSGEGISTDPAKVASVASLVAPEEPDAPAGLPRPRGLL